MSLQVKIFIEFTPKAACALFFQIQSDSTREEEEGHTDTANDTETFHETSNDVTQMSNENTDDVLVYTSDVTTAVNEPYLFVRRGSGRNLNASTLNSVRPLNQKNSEEDDKKGATLDSNQVSTFLSYLYVPFDCPFLIFQFIQVSVMANDSKMLHSATVDNHGPQLLV